MAQAQVKEEKELKPGEREPEGKDGPKVSYAAGKITELLLGLHNDDRPRVAEALTKLGLLSGGKSKIEQDQEDAAKKAKEESAKWVKEAKFHNQKVAEEAAKAAQEKHKTEESKGKAK